MFETFVKEKTTLLGYVHDLVRFAAKLQEIDLTQTTILPLLEETKSGDELRIKNNRECYIIGVRVGLVVSITELSYSGPLFVAGKISGAIERVGPNLGELHHTNHELPANLRS